MGPYRDDGSVVSGPGSARSGEPASACGEMATAVGAGRPAKITLAFLEQERPANPVRFAGSSRSVPVREGVRAGLSSEGETVFVRVRCRPGVNVNRNLGLYWFLEGAGRRRGSQRGSARPEAAGPHPHAVRRRERSARVARPVDRRVQGVGRRQGNRWGPAKPGAAVRHPRAGSSGPERVRPSRAGGAGPVLAMGT
jgi:hypothetical protein